MSKASTYVARHWKGELPYAFNFLINCVVITSVGRFLMLQVFANFNWQNSLADKVALTYAMCIGTAITVWGIVGGFRHLLKNAITAKISISYLWIFVYTFFIGRTYLLLIQRV